MTVAELIIALQKLPQNQEVRIYDATAGEYRQIAQTEQEPNWITVDVEPII
jgi:hypothetical protein